MPSFDLKAIITAEDRASSIVKSFGDSVDSAMEKAATGSKMLLGGLIALGTAATGMTLTAARTETLGVAMNAVARATGTSTEVLAEQEKILKKQGITTQEARSTLTQFMQSQLDVAQASKIARVAQDLAVIAGVNSSEATKTLTNAIVSQEPMLLRQFGIVKNLPVIYDDYAKSIGKSADELTDVEKKQAMINTILEAGTKVTGTYEDAMGTAGKKLTSLPRYFQEAANSIGSVFLPVMNKAIDGLTEALKKITPENVEKFKNVVVENAPIIIGAILVGLVPAFYSLASAIWAAMAPLLPWVAAGALLGLAAKLLMAHFGGLTNIFQEHKKTIEIVGAAFAGIATVMFIAFIPAMYAAAAAAVTAAAAFLLPLLPFILIGAAVGILAYLIYTNWEKIKNWTIGLGNSIVNIWNGIIGWFGGIGSAISGAMSNVWDAITSPFKTAFQAIIRFWNDTVGKIKVIVPNWIPGIGGKSFGFPTFQTGGIMPYTGLAFLHKGERIIPSSHVVNNDNGVTVNFYGDIQNTANASLDAIGKRLGRQIELARAGI